MKLKLCNSLLVLALSVSFAATAQTGKIPPFSMVQPGLKTFKAAQLPVGKPVIIIYFSPECDHCEKLTKELINHSVDFKKASIAMVTFLPVEQVSKFVADHQLNKHANIYVGTEGSSFFLKNYYKLTKMPFMALYNKQGDLVKLYRNEDGLKDLSEKLKQLK